MRDLALQRQARWQLQLYIVWWLELRRPLVQKHSCKRVHHPPEVAILDRVSQHVLHSNMKSISQLLQCTLFNIAAA